MCWCYITCGYCSINSLEVFRIRQDGTSPRLRFPREVDTHIIAVGYVQLAFDCLFTRSRASAAIELTCFAKSSAMGSEMGVYLPLEQLEFGFGYCRRHLHCSSGFRICCFSGRRFVSCMRLLIWIWKCLREMRVRKFGMDMICYVRPQFHLLLLVMYLVLV